MTTIHQHALPSGTEFAGFRIEGVLGAGGFGITYRARTVGSATPGGERVAVKEYLPRGIATREPEGFSVMPVSTDDTEDYGFGLERFRAEAEVLARFSHPNLVRTRDFFEANGTAYLIMDFVDGESLYARLKPDRTLDGPALDAIVAPLLDGLESVHAGKVLHRDIKPGNIVVQRDGTPVLIDFGAAREALGEKSQSLTSIFTPGYAPPEQYHRRGNQGPWTDIYALAATVYRCITGERPPPAVERVMKDDYVPVAGRIGAGHAPSLLRAVDAALRIEEADRPQDVADWRRLISGEIDEVSQITRAMPRPHTSNVAPNAAPKLAPKLPPARPRKRPGARPALSDAAPARMAGGSWRRWGTTLASFAVLITAGTIGYYGLEQYRGGAGGEGEPVVTGRAAPPGTAEGGGQDEAARKRRSARPPARPTPQPAPRAAAPALGCAIAVAALRPHLAAGDCKAIAAILDRPAAQAPRAGRTIAWRNAATGHAGTLSFEDASTDAAGRPCWRLRQTFTGGGVTASGAGLACKLDAGWRIVK